jgi:DtxR family transcriptional regulator, Mn-dependent transcriptional regulator
LTGRLVKVVTNLDDQSEFHTVRGYQLLDQNRKRLTSAMEDYIEMIYRHYLIEGSMRINTLADLLNVQPPSATKMIQKLTKLELVNYKKYGIITLTKAGLELGKFLFERHNIIESFLKNLGARDNVLLETELIEHSISAFTVHRLELFNSYIRENPNFLSDIERRSILRQITSK